MKRQRRLVKGTLVSMGEIPSIDTNEILEELKHSDYVSQDELEEILEKKEHQLEFGLVTGSVFFKTTEPCEMWTETYDFETELDSAFLNFSYQILEFFLDKDRKMMPYLAILFDGHNLEDYGILSLDIDLKNLYGLTWFDLSREEQDFLLEDGFDLDDNILELGKFLKIEVDPSSTEENLIFLDNKVFYER